jgi:hypothetical protein
MNIEMAFTGEYTPAEVREGNVYPVRGGRGAKLGNMMILMAISKPAESWQGQMALMLIVSKDGDPVGMTQYGLHYLADKLPIAYADGVEDMTFTIRPF